MHNYELARLTWRRCYLNLPTQAQRHELSYWLIGRLCAAAAGEPGTDAWDLERLIERQAALIRDQADELPSAGAGAAGDPSPVAP